MQTQSDFAWALLTELRKEIVASQSIRATIVGFKITFVSGAIGLIVANGVDPILLVIPAFAATFFDFLINSYSISVKRIGTYICQYLDSKLRARFDWPADEPMWEEFMAQPANRQRFSLIGNLGLTLVANAPSMIVLVQLWPRWYALVLFWALAVFLAFDVVGFLKPRWLVQARLRARPLAILACIVVSGAASMAAQPAPAVQHPAGDYVTVNGARIWYESEGKGEPLVLIAGGPGSAHYFHPYFSGLADTYRVISFDAFGRGKSDRAKAPAEYTFERDVEDLEGLRKALGLETINLLGHSYGGMVAQAYALKYPGAVKRLILANTIFSAEMWQANNDNCNYEARNQLPEMWAKVEEVRGKGHRSKDKEHQAVYQLPPALLYFYDASKAANFVWPETNLDVYYTMVGDDGDFIIGGDIARLDFRRALADLKMPILVIGGRYDRVVLPRFAVQFKRYAPQAELVMFEKSGHLTFVEEPEATMRVLREFLAK